MPKPAIHPNDFPVEADKTMSRPTRVSPSRKQKVNLWRRRSPTASTSKLTAKNEKW